MKFEELSEQEIQELEAILLQKAKDFWLKLYGLKEATDVDKFRLLTRQGHLQNKLHHDIIVNYFKKRGLWRDGKTTLEERIKILANEKKKYGYKVAQIRDAKLKSMNEIIEKAQKKKEQLKQIPIQLHEEYKINKEELLEKLEGDLDELFDLGNATIDKEIGDRYKEFLVKIEKRQNELIDKAKEDVLHLQKKAKQLLKFKVETFSSELEAELVVHEYGDRDDMLIEEHNEHIKDLNRELNELTELTSKKEEVEEDTIEVDSTEEDLNQLTKAQLKEIADNNGISYDSRILKADLIKLLIK